MSREGSSRAIQGYALSGLLAVALLAAACGRSSEGGLAAGMPVPFPGEVELLTAVPVTTDWFVGPNNFGVLLAHEDGQLVVGAEVTLTFWDLRDRARPRAVAAVPAVESAPAAARGSVDAYYAPFAFPRAGPWGVEVRARLPDGRTGVARVAISVAAKSSLVAPGQPAPPSDNLTRAEVDDVRRIDSGLVPNNLHEWKIRDALARGRPLVVVFATPAHCTSRACGPVVAEVGALAERYGHEVAFVHIEVWEDAAAGVVHPAVRDWLVRRDGGFSEPWVFVVDRRGIVYDRWAGPVSRELLEPSVGAVASGATWPKDGR